MYIGDEEKAIIFDTVKGDDVLDYYGYLRRAKKGYNPFRDDKKAGSFHKTKRGTWIDYAEDMRYDPALMVAIEEGLDIKSDYPLILEKLATIGGLEFEDKKPDKKRQKKPAHIPSSAERMLLGLCQESCMIVRDYKSFAISKPDFSLDYDRAGGGYLTYDVKKVRWADLAEKDQKEVNDLVKRKAYEKIYRNQCLIKELSDPASKISITCLKTGILPEEAVSALKTKNTTLFGLYRDYGGEKEYKVLLGSMGI